MVKNIFIREVKIAYNSSSQYGQQSHRDVFVNKKVLQKGSKKVSTFNTQ